MLLVFLALFVLEANLFDIATTYYTVERLGMTEGNPLLNWLIVRVGLLPALFLKLLATLPIVWFASRRWYLPATSSLVWLTYRRWFLFGLAGCYFLVMAGNNILRIIQGAGG